MKLVKNFLFAALLVSVMAVTTLAGDQNTPGYACTPTATNNYCQGQLVADEPDTDETGDIAPETTDYLFYEALAALLSVY